MSVTDDHVHFHSAVGSGFSVGDATVPGMETLLDDDHAQHPGDGFEAIPDDAARPREVTIRPRYADDTTDAWVSAAIGDVVSLPDSR